MAKKRTPKELLEKSLPIVQPYLEDKLWFREFMNTLVETARQMNPTQANKAAYALCLEEGLYWQTADHFAKACRYLAILRKYHEQEFCKAIGEN